MKRLTTFARLLVAAATVMFAPPLFAEEPGRLQFDFGGERSRSGFTRVAPEVIYSNAIGYGFEPGASLAAHAQFVTSAKPFLFSVHLAEGNYRVVVTLGDDHGESS